MPKKKPDKSPLKSRSMISAYLIIIVGILQYFGIISPEQDVKVTIDGIDAPVSSPVDQNKIMGVGLAVAGYVGAKGRRGAKEGIGELL